MIETITIDTEQWAVVPREATISMLVHVAGISEKQARKHYAELLAAAPRPEAGRSAPLSDSDLVNIIYRAGLGHTSDLLYEKSKDGIEVDYPTVEARKLAAFLMRQPDRTPKIEPRPVPTSEFEPNNGCKTPGHCRTAGFCADAWACSSIVRPAEPDGGAV